MTAVLACKTFVVELATTFEFVLTNNVPVFVSLCAIKLYEVELFTTLILVAKFALAATSSVDNKFVALATDNVLDNVVDKATDNVLFKVVALFTYKVLFTDKLLPIVALLATARPVPEPFAEINAPNIDLPALFKPNEVFEKYTWPCVTVKLFWIETEDPVPVLCNVLYKTTGPLACKALVGSETINVPNFLL